MSISGLPRKNLPSGYHSVMNTPMRINESVVENPRQEKEVEPDSGLAPDTSLIPNSPGQKLSRQGQEREREIVPKNEKHTGGKRQNK